MLGGKRLYSALNKYLTTELEEQYASGLSGDFYSEPLQSRVLVPCDNEFLLVYMSVKRRRITGVKGGTITSELKENILALIESWPEGLRRYFQTHVRNVFIVRNLGASGYVVTHDNVSFTILIDESILSMTPNAWFQRKEATVVNLNDEEFKLRHRIEDDAFNIPERLIEDVLIHELGHCVGVSEGLTTAFHGESLLGQYLGLFDGVFQLPAVRMRMHEDIRKTFPKLRYYGSETQLDPLEYIDLLNRLKDSEFPSLYATVSDLEFFAEYFYTYVHCHIQQRPLWYTVLHKQDTVVHLRTPLFNEQNSERFEFIQSVVSTLKIDSIHEPRFAN